MANSGWRRISVFTGWTGLGICLLSLTVLAQPGPRPSGRAGKSPAEILKSELDKAHRDRSNSGDPAKERKVPTDPKLQVLYKDFVEKTVKLAQEYEKANDLDSARICYEEILYLFPDYEPAKLKLNEYLQREASAQKKVVDVFANKDWQDTGLVVIAGKPLVFTAEGSWIFNISYKIGPDGVPIPEDLRDFNLGALIGMIDTGNPKENKAFVIGQSLKLIPKLSGRLLVRIYDSDVSDNAGKLQLEVQGTFRK
ncbi:MAG: hypothetical protein SFX18_11420 [Pirellulales bacterium]|nr:hypothetical protein [Pirellulales bacterium]